MLIKSAFVALKKRFFYCITGALSLTVRIAIVIERVATIAVNTAIFVPSVFSERFCVPHHGYIISPEFLRKKRVSV